MSGFSPPLPTRRNDHYSGALLSVAVVGGPDQAICGRARLSARRLLRILNRRPCLAVPVFSPAGRPRPRI